ncbi:MAG: hypothetical protein U0235_21265 [Polyangiaceae bacterium]
MSVDDDLKKLPPVDLEPAARDRTLARALHEFDDEHALAGESRAVAFVQRATRALVPVVVAGSAIVYLTWAFSAASALYP